MFLCENNNIENTYWVFFRKKLSISIQNQITKYI